MWTGTQTRGIDVDQVPSAACWPFRGGLWPTKKRSPGARALGSVFLLLHQMTVKSSGIAAHFRCFEPSNQNEGV